jgi:nitrite reductase/ring-hydroxylating ferredoxin subunit
MSHSVPAANVHEGTVTGVEEYAVGNNGEYFAVGRKCRHLRADLAGGSIDAEGCLVCPWHGAKYDVITGHMVGGPQGIFANPRPGRQFHGLDPGDSTEARQDRKAWHFPLHRLIA